MNLDESRWKEIIRDGMARFPKGPPAEPLLVAVSDQVERLIRADPKDMEEINSALHLSLESAPSRAPWADEDVGDASKMLLDAASAYVAARTPRGFRVPTGAATNKAERNLCAARNMLSVAVAAKMPPEEPAIDHLQPQ